MQHLPKDPIQKEHVPQNLALVYLVGNPHLHPAIEKRQCNNNDPSNQVQSVLLFQHTEMQKDKNTL
jgi:hypothetical protein